MSTAETPARRRITPLDPDSAEGRAMAARLTAVLADIAIEIERRQAREKGAA
jgi:hypothetical protein